MPHVLFRTVAGRLLLALATLLTLALPARAADAPTAPLVSVAWLQQNLGNPELLVIDASPQPMYARAHIRGAVNADLFSFGARELPPAEMERKLQSWGVSAQRKIVLYDADGLMWATRIFFDLAYRGFPVQNLFVLDGGLAKWVQQGGAVTSEATPAPPPGDFRIGALREELRVRLPEFLAASGEPRRVTLVEALDPEYYYGGAKFFDRAGHVPNATLLPRQEFFNADGTFKPADELRRMLAYHGIDRNRPVYSYCGGGVAATVPFFAMKYLLGHTDARVYLGSQLEWLRDERGLPVWTWARPQMLRDAPWLSAWGAGFLRGVGLSGLNVVDVRAPEAFQLGHVPFAANVPVAFFKAGLREPAGLTQALAAAGVNPAQEAVIVSEGGLNPASALAYVMLERAGQARVSLLLESVDEWGLRGFTLNKPAAAASASPAANAAPRPPTASTAARTLREDVLVRDAAAGGGVYPKVFLSAGRQVWSPPSVPGKVIHVPFNSLLNTDGSPKPAKEVWTLLSKAGVPRYAEVQTLAEEPGEAAVVYVVMKLMGWPDVKLWLP